MGNKIAIAFAVIVVVFFVGSFVIDGHMLGQTYARVTTAKPNYLPTEEYMADYESTPVEFQMEGGTLRGYVYAADDPKGFIVFRHGIFSKHTDYLALIGAMVDRGWTVYAYDAIGCGISDGESTIGMAQSPLDVVEAIRFVRENNLNAGLPLVLWGHSWGGYGVSAAMDIEPDVDACVEMSGFNEPFTVLAEATERIMGPFALTQQPTIWLQNKLAFGDNANREAISGINKTEAPVLIIHGTADAVVEYDGSSIIAQRDRITNPGAEYYVFDEDGRNGHNSYFYSVESNEYLAGQQAKLDALGAEYGDAIPDEVLDAFWAGFDMKRGNAANPDLINLIDDFLTKAVGGDNVEKPKADEYGELQSAEYSNSGDMNGNLYSIEAKRSENGETIVTIREAKMHSDPISVGEYRVGDDVLDKISAIVDAAGIKEWGELPLSEFIALDASTPSIRLTYASADPNDRFPLWLSYSTTYELPDDGESLRAIRDLLQASVTEADLIRTYTEEVR